MQLLLIEVTIITILIQYEVIATCVNDKINYESIFWLDIIMYIHTCMYVVAMHLCM